MFQKLFRRQMPRGPSNGAQYQLVNHAFNRANVPAISLSCSIPITASTRPRFGKYFQTTRQVFRRGDYGRHQHNARRLTHDLKTSRQGSLRNTVANRLLSMRSTCCIQRGRGGGGIRLGKPRQRQSGKRAVNTVNARGSLSP